MVFRANSVLADHVCIARRVPEAWDANPAAPVEPEAFTNDIS